MNGFETYSAFQLQVRDASGKTVYDSGMRLTPELDADGNYSWTPDDLFVDDQCFDGTAVTANGGGVSDFANAGQYTWRVRMHNIKFGNDNTGWSDYAPQFRMNVNVASEANDAGYSCIKAAVKYFGPQEVLGGLLHPGAAGKVRVEAFTSPDFTGAPVARGYFAGSSKNTSESLRKFESDNPSVPRASE
jgi:hypothetical protein